ncbi:cell division protein FtsA [Endobacter medicaginis]|uniref:Cell division protein FtsA n=3 Tax=Endobacter medicaginis TaxID=1181271 RepID=A0A839V035_9PROT|nr:cell division protein FtsA [Endobacter medicaginis]MBB3173934.1 cell division protein FtsA [Endobacter medicaginis]MCX5476961.1 cell division protein FtsA [Endobacter medicaginis]
MSKPARPRRGLLRRPVVSQEPVALLGYDGAEAPAGDAAEAGALALAHDQPMRREPSPPGVPSLPGLFRDPAPARAPASALAPAPRRQGVLALATPAAAAGTETALAIVPPPVRRRRLKGGTFGALDIGSTKITCLIGRADSAGNIKVIGHGWQRSRGVRAGGIVDLDEAERTIRAAVGQAEEMADHRLRSVTVGLSCGQPESRIFNVRWPVGGQVVGDADVRRVVSEGRLRAQTEGRDLVHALPLTFAVDQTTGVDDPRGHHCEQLTARLHVIDASTMALRNLRATLARCDLDVATLVSTPLASGLSVLTEDERELGATVVDLGGGTTQIAVFGEGQMLHTALLPVGGLHVTKDIAGMLSTRLESAERLKVLYGNAELSAEDEREYLPVQLIAGEDDQFARVPRSMIVGIIRPRLEETFELVRDRLDGAGIGLAAASRVVLTGGASQLDGVPELAARILGRQVRAGRPGRITGLPDSASAPAFATASGLLAFAAGDGQVLPDIDFNEPRPPGLMRRVVGFLRERM